MDAILPNIIAGFAMIPFTGSTWFILFTMMFFVFLFFRASRDPNSLISWEDMIVESRNNKASPYKLGYLVGIIISTWIVIKLADGNNLGLDIFGAYLAYLLGGAGFNTYIKNTAAKPKPEEPSQ